VVEVVVGSTRLAAGLHTLIAELRPDVVVIDCNLSVGGAGVQQGVE
jgi:hypothetical protein